MRTREYLLDTLGYDAEKLQSMYVGDGLSLRAMADQIGCSYSTLRETLKRHGIDRRQMPSHGHRRGGERTPTNQTWRSMRARCLDPHHPRWDRYGGRGITVCARWAWFENFLADMGERPPGLTLDRIDSDGNYEPANCRWATWSEQAAGRSSTKLTMEDARTIRASEESLNVLAARYGVTAANISAIRTGRIWREAEQNARRAANSTGAAQSEGWSE